MVLSVALAASALPTRLRAQPPRPAPVGGIVRVMAPPVAGWREGRLVGYDAAAVVVRRADTVDAHGALAARVDTIPRGAVQRVEVRHSSGRAVRVVGGGLTGALVGLMAGAAVGSQSNRYEGDDPGIDTLARAVVGTGVGLVGGIIVGAHLPLRTRWVPARVPAAAAP
jgi:hypothetical protein